MNKQTLLVILVAILLIMNVALMLGMFWGPKGPGGPGHPPGRGARPSIESLVIDRLEFDAEQTAAYKQLIREHSRDVESTVRNVRELKQELYQQIGIENGREVELMAELSTLQQEIEGYHYQHFKDIRNLCKPEQLELFDDFKTELSKIFMPREGPPRQGRK